MSAARPKIADYPFTTLTPNLGVVTLSDDRSFVVADVPGLIEGASEGKGLGHRFLRHVERARVLCVLVDLAWATTGGAPPAEQERVLLDELGRYQPDLLERPRVVVGSRADLVAPDDGDFDGLRVSAVTGTGLRELTGRMATLVQQARDEQPVSEGFVVLRPVTEGFHVERIDNGWIVRGREAERAVALSDITNADALAYAQARLRSIGVDRALARAGAKTGDVVHIGSFSFDYEPDDVFESAPPRRERRA